MRALSLLAAALVTAAVPAPAPAQGAWTDQTIESIREFSLTESSLQIDAAGRPHVFVGGDRVYHYWRDGAAWQSEIADAAPRSGERLRAAQGPDGAFHLIYLRHDSSPRSTLNSSQRIDTLRYATNSGGAWRSEQVPTPPGESTPQYQTVTGLVVDSAQRPHLVLYNVETDPTTGNLTQKLYLLSRDATGWSWEPLNDPAIDQGHTATDFYASSQLALDASDRIHAIWFTASGDSLVYARRDSGGWQHERLDAVAGVTLDPERDPSALHVEPDGTPHVFVNGGGFRLLHLWRDGAAWQLEDLGRGAAGLATALDAQGEPHLVARRVGGGPTGFEIAGIYAFRGESGWTVEDPPPEVLSTNSLALRVGAAGDVHLATLVDTGSRSLGHRQRSASPFWSAQVELDRSGPLTVEGEHAILRTENLLGADVRIGVVDGRRRVVYRDGRLGSSGTVVRRALEQPGGSFALQSLPGLGTRSYVEPRSLGYALGPGGSEHVVWVGAAGLQEARDDGSGPVARLLGNVPPGSVLHARAPGVRFGSSFLDVFYAEYHGSELGLVHFSASDALVLRTPVAELDLSSSNGRLRQLALSPHPGPGGVQYAAYLENDREVVRARNAYDGNGWTTEVVGTLPWDQFAGSHALAVEPDGTVHLAYERFVYDPRFLSNRPDGIAYGSTRCLGGFWTTDVDPAWEWRELDLILHSKNPDLVLDPNGNPHIAYSRDIDRSLGYARLVDGRFALETVLLDTYAREHSALAVEVNGRVSLAHHDAWAGDVLLATRAPEPLEPRWDGCPPLPDPEAPLDGIYVFETPPGALPLYVPEPELEEKYGAAHAWLSEEVVENGRLFAHGRADYDGDETFDTDLQGKGKISGNGRQVRVTRKLAIRDAARDEGPSVKLKVARSERIDPVSRQREVVESVTGAIDGERVRLKRSFADQVPAEAFGIRLLLEFRETPTGVEIEGYWYTSDHDVIMLRGSAAWSADSHSAELRLRGKKIDIRLSGLRVWRTEADGTHLRADSIDVRGLGQRVSADLSSAW